MLTVFAGFIGGRDRNQHASNGLQSFCANRAR